MAKANRPITGQREATATAEEVTAVMPARLIQTPPMSAEMTTVRTGPNQFGRIRASKARYPLAKSQGRRARTGRARPRKSHSARRRLLRAAAAVQAADQRRQAAVRRRKKAK